MVFSIWDNNELILFGGQLDQAGRFFCPGQQDGYPVRKQVIENRSCYE